MACFPVFPTAGKHVDVFQSDLFPEPVRDLFAVQATEHAAIDDDSGVIEIGQPVKERGQKVFPFKLIEKSGAWDMVRFIGFSGT